MSGPRLRGPAPIVPTIELHGLYGSFRVDNARVWVRYVSTFANSHGPAGHAALLKELKPMRERLTASELQDLSSLLQRDLNDDRVAHELIPYLSGKYKDVVFFPAILAVVVPQGYLRAGIPKIAYPRPVESADGTLDYGGYWEVSRFTLDGASEPSPLAVMRISLSKAEVIVLDGQHRANAFRFMSRYFTPDPIYESFYHGVSPPESFDLDLPVTLIWFEAEEDREIDPTLISRELFVDVNNTAESVSASRTILLDDRAVTSVATQQVYGRAAAQGFQPESFSLLHSSFDMDSDLAEGVYSKFAVTTPEIIEEAIRWGFFGSPNYDELTRESVTRQRRLKHIARFDNIFPSVRGLRGVAGEDDDDTGKIYFSSSDQAKAFRSAFDERFLPVLSQLFDSLALLRPHYSACKHTIEWVRERDTMVQDTWSKVFCGGEGLYWTFQRSGGAARAKNYRLAIGQIEKELLEERARQFPLDTDVRWGDTQQRVVEIVYGSFVSKAFQSGYVMAVDFLARRRGLTRSEAAGELIESLNTYSLSNWAGVFVKLRPLLAPEGVSPRFWPTYRNLLIRMYDGTRMEFFSERNYTASPEWIAFGQLLRDAAGAFGRTHAETIPTDDEIGRAARTAYGQVLETLHVCGLDSDWFSKERSFENGVSELAALVVAKYPPTT